MVFEYVRLSELDGDNNEERSFKLYAQKIYAALCARPINYRLARERVCFPADQEGPSKCVACKYVPLSELDSERDEERSFKLCVRNLGNSVCSSGSATRDS